jgi:predicted flap endonuclease-1-like 5' DNA nuclease
MRLVEYLGHIWRRLVSGSSEQQPAAEPKPHDAESEGATVERANSEPETQKPTAKEAPPKPAEDAASEAPEDGPLDDLTAIRGIGAATQKRLNATGIRSYAQLADADPEDVRRALNEQQQDTKVERWISRARELVRNDWRPI